MHLNSSHLMQSDLTLLFGYSVSTPLMVVVALAGKLAVREEYAGELSSALKFAR